MTPSDQKPPEVVALIPAAGQATRISPLPLSKELYPIGFQSIDDCGNLRPKVVGQYLLERLRRAGITKTYIILRSGKWDIPAYFGDGSALGMSLGYLMMGRPYGVPYTLDQAYPFVKDAIVAMGFPDLLLQPEEVFVRLLDRQSRNQADVVLGAFPSNQPYKVGMVDFDETGRVLWIVEKPKTTHLRYMWGVAVWTPAFTQFLHIYLADLERDRDPNVAYPEVPIGDVIQAAIEKGLKVEAEAFPEGAYLDIGTPEDLMRAVREPTW
ncbi:MAG TPA: sugar phosphate nucleotidyltransferase [Thermosynechococcaceae cyanobacterium]